MNDQSTLFDRKMFGLPRSPKPGRGAAKGISRKHLDKMLWIYAVHDRGEGLTKIGVSINLDNRMAALRSSCPRPLELTTAISVMPARTVGICEEYVHEVLGARRAHGEWFFIPAACADTFIRLSLAVAQRHSHPGFFDEASKIGNRTPAS